VVSSSGPREGKSTICANLAVALAEKDVLWVDGLPWKPTLHEPIAIQNARGLVSVPTKRCAVEDAWHESMPKLKVLTAGPEPHDFTDLLASERFTEFMNRARKGFDHVPVDAPPVDMGLRHRRACCPACCPQRWRPSRHRRKENAQEFRAPKREKPRGRWGGRAWCTVMTNFKRR
jgi:hypothetical protein